MIIDPSVRPSDNLSGDYAASAFWAAADVVEGFADTEPFRAARYVGNVESFQKKDAPRFELRECRTSKSRHRPHKRTK